MSNHPPGAMNTFPPGYPDEAQNNEKLVGNYGAVTATQSPSYSDVGGAPSPPPPYSMEKVPGYEDATFDNAISPPPTAPDSTEPPPESPPLANLPQFTDQEVRDAVIRFASADCCYGTGPAVDMEITEIAMNSAFRYTLETFGEKRESAWGFVPFIAGQYIDGPSNGPAPKPWEIPIKPHHNFKNFQIRKEVPHTAFVKPCHVCVGNGRVRCELCRGRGRLNSSSSVRVDRCYSCSGRGQQECRTCAGRGNLKGFVELTVTWKNHLSEYVSETTEVPKEQLRNACGKVALQQEMPKVVPVSNAGGGLVNTVSQTFIAKHKQSFPNERVLCQRQILLIIPIAQCSYNWKDKTGNFCVYGFEHSVHFPSYPQQWCCGCNIL